ncbi:MAG: pantoate--beta-alanine ligase [Acidobacteria bacterium]|nr:pantoate--beta-alanine ligase [Acidobacteriota bacterium]
MEVVDTIAELRARLAGRRGAGSSIGLVPTMGALHRGHRSLMELARGENSTVVVSIFVNPTQFNQAEDYQRYPRTLTSDVALCESAGADLVFAPSAAEMYPEAARTVVEVTKLTDGLCGLNRPGHFRGVALVVMKLLQIVQPQRAYFGEKDAQQLAVIERLVRDLNVPVAIVGVATVRENDGVALSSRNQLLTAEERATAAVLYRALRAAASAIEGGERDPGTIRRVAMAVLETEPAVRVEYLEVVDPATMGAVAAIDGATRIAVAAWLGRVRLIDNVLAAPVP